MSQRKVLPEKLAVAQLLI